MAIDKSLAEMHWKHDLLGSIEVGIVVLNRNFEVQVWNQFMENHSSIVPGFIMGKCLFDFFPEIDRQWFERKAQPVFTLRCPVFVIWEQRPYLFKFGPSRSVTSQAEHMYQNITIFPLASLSGAVEQICIVVYDVTDESLNRKGMQSLNKQLAKVNRIDSFTGLMNRRAWQEQFELEFKRSKRSNHPSSLVLLDVDKLANVNAAYSQSAGDEVLTMLAQIVNKAIRETDISCRFDDDEFALLLPDTPVANVAFLTGRLQRLIDNAVVRYNNNEIGFSVSVGVAGFDPGYADYRDWLKAAQQALGEAKNAGGNQVAVFG